MTWMQEGPPASVDYRDDRRHERGPAGLSSFEGRVDAGYLLWARVPYSNLSCTALTLSHSEDRACTRIYENCLVCLQKSATPSYFWSKPLAQAFLLLGSGSLRVSFNIREQPLTYLHNAEVFIYTANPQAFLKER